MFRLLYISPSRAPIDDAMLTDILTVSRRNNARDGITGLLVVGGARFLQILEGEEPAVRAAYDRIAKDERHFACVTLEERSVERREFAQWAMGAVTLDDPAGLAELHKRIEGVEDRNLRAQFDSFVRQHGGGRAAA